MYAKELQNLRAYYETFEREFDIAHNGEAWIAALAIGCSLAECALLMRAISSITLIRSLPGYGDVTVEKLCSNKWGLDNLNKIGLKLGWFDFRMIDETLIGKFIEVVEEGVGHSISSESATKVREAVGAVFLHLAKEQRNILHPGRAAKAVEETTYLALSESAGGFCAIVSTVLKCFRDTQINQSLEPVRNFVPF